MEDAIRQQIALRGKRLEYFTIGWNTLEGLVAVIAGAVAGSVSLVGFGTDSLIEVISGTALLWRMGADADAESRERKERLSLRIVGTCFLVLAAYVTFESVSDIVKKTPLSTALPESSWRAFRSSLCPFYLAPKERSEPNLEAERWRRTHGKPTFAYISLLSCSSVCSSMPL